MKSATHQPRKAGPRPRGGVALPLVMVVAVVALIAAGYLFVALHWSYSEGERAGVLQKFSRKGWVVKTWEGELQMVTVPGVPPELWNFSCRDRAVADRLTATLVKKVALHYAEHRGLPGALFGDTRYFVDRVRVIE
jgi:hypothetical protein